MGIKKTVAILLVVCFIVSVTVAAVSANQQEYNRGYKEGCRDGYKDGFREGKTDSKKPYSAFIKKEARKSDYDKGYERGYSDCFPKGYKAGLRAGSAGGNQKEYDRGYKEGCRDGYKDGFREGKADSRKPYSAFIKKEARKSDYARGYERGYSDCFPRGYQAGLKAGSGGGKQKEYDAMLSIANLASIHYLRQQKPLGLGHAVWCARTFVGDEPFAVLYGDDVIIGENPACAQLCAAYQEYGLGVAGIKPVSPQAIHKYSSLGVEHMVGNRYKIHDMIEKPPPGQELSLYSILGRCVLPPKIFGILETLPKGAGGEIQLTDAMRILTHDEGMIGVEYEGTRYDMGSKLGYMQANVEMAAVHPEIGPEFIAYLKEFTKDL